MFRHVVLLTWKPDTTDEQIELVRSGLSELPELVPGIRDYRIGADAGLVEGNADFAITADFDDTDGYLIYRTHPAHVAVLNSAINPIVAQRIAVQYEI
jgi:Stress responsive A/B Barrel Domain